MENGKDSGDASSNVDIEKIYQKKSQLEHVLLRPDTYIGTVEHTKEVMWVFNPETNAMVQKEISFVPGLYKIFDEILVNAADNKQRDKNMSCIKIDIDPEKNLISVWNNGKGIPVVMHKTEKMFVPTMIFGHLLTSSNYNDEEQKVTGGRNGYGAKLCNIFSTSFKVETASAEYKQSFSQTWGSNMSKASKPKIKSFSGQDYTRVTFSPDLAKFNMTTLDDDIVQLMSRRAYDIAASTRGVSVFLNGNKLPVKSFKDYIDLYLKDYKDDGGNPIKLIYENVNERWEIAVAPSDRGFQQVSFVNSIATTKGGKHVDHVVDNIVKQLIEVVKKKNKGGINIKPFQVRNHLWIFVNCLIVNPTFDSQTKENMTLQVKNFGSKCSPTEKFITNVSKSGIVESILSWARFKAANDLAKTSGKKNSKIRGLPKLEDANEAGTKNSHLCTLILTEGDSAKTLAVSGLAVVERDYYGVFPLRGKLLNVREATHKQILENAEINSLIKIIGLQYKKKYLTIEDLKTLRYGKVMIMTDQDQDGSHIKGLLINFFHTNWPELLRLPFLEEFITPIVKATKKDVELSFYSLPEFEEWKKDTRNHNTYNIKYYKGLGTSTAKEAQEYFKNMERHRILFKYDGVTDDEHIVMAFAKKYVEQRKDWLNKHMEECKRRKVLGLPEEYLYGKQTKQVSYTEFINLELVLFSNADNVRSIPCVVDGLKPGQRKVMYTCFKRNDKREVKVAQLSGSIAEMSAYHHGEVSLSMTIVNLAQNFVGSNNINLLEPRGQFGTRLAGGKDSASPRYIFTIMSPLTRLIFRPEDDPLLQYEYDDNQKIEPVWYIPIIPMVLVNGCEGIGTGWSTKIPNHNPRDIIKNIRKMIAHEEPDIMHPWYKNFKGSIDYISDQRYLASGNVAIIGDNKIEITELPIGVWTQTYKENVLEPLLHGSDKIKPILNEYKEYHTDTTVRFVCQFIPGEFDKIQVEEGGFHRIFKLSSSLNLGIMHAFDSNNCLRRYNSAIEILKEYFTLRLEFYGKRKAYLEGQLAALADKLSDQARFIVEKCNNTIIVENKKRKDIIDELIKRGYRSDPVKAWQKRIQNEDEEEGEVEIEQSDIESKKEDKKPIDPDVSKYDYLLGMSMWMLTEERKNELLTQKDLRLSELVALRAKTVEMIWLEDLDELENKLNEVEEKERLDALGLNTKPNKVPAAKSKAGLGSRKAVTGSSQIFPSSKGTKVNFKITSEILRKFEKIAVAAGIKKEKPIKKEKTAEVEMDEFDALVEDGAVSKLVQQKEKKQKVAKEPGEKPEKKKREKKTDEDGAVSKVVQQKEKKQKAAKEQGEKPEKKKREKKTDGMKQTKLKFDNKQAKKDRKNESDDSDEDDFNCGKEILEVRERPGRRAASKKIDYSALLSDNEEEAVAITSESEAELFEEIVDNDSSDIDQSSPIKSAVPKRPRKESSDEYLNESSDDLSTKKKKNRKALSDDDFE